MTTLQTIFAALNWNARVNENFASVSPAALYGLNPATTTGLTFGYLGGQFNGNTVPNGTLTLSASGTHYVVADRSTGDVSSSTGTTDWDNASGFVQLYVVVTGTSTITSTTDYRQAIGGGGGGSSGAVDSVNGQTGAVVLDTDDVSEGSTNLYYTAERVQDMLSSFLVAGSNVTLTYNDVANTLTIAASGGGGGGMTNPMTTDGDIIIGGTSGTPQRLPAGTNGYVLTMVSGAPAWAAGAGGGGLTNFTESVNSSSPNGSVPVVRLSATNAASDVDIAFSPKGSGALTAQVADNTTLGGAKRGSRAVDWQMSRDSSNQVASGGFSVVSGGDSNRAAGAYSVVSGGVNNTVTSNYATIAGGLSATVSGDYGFIGGGSTNTASGQQSSVVGGANSIASATGSSVIGGSANSASAQASGVFASESGTADGRASAVLASSYATTRATNYSIAHAGGRFSAAGDSQSRQFIVMRSTSDATPTSLSVGGGSPAAGTAITLVDSSAYAFEALVTGRESSTGDCCSFSVRGLIKRGANAAATAIVGSVTSTSIAADSGAAAWAVTAVANTTLGALEIQVTGAASKTIRWSALVRTVEVAS